MPKILDMLKACTFCKGTDLAVVDIMSKDKRTVQIACECGARGPKAETQIKAAKLWNFRR